MHDDAMVIDFNIVFFNVNYFDGIEIMP